MLDYKYLNQITSPNELKTIEEVNVPFLCDEIREFLVENVSKTGGHLASNLGIVELTVAMHRVFDSPHDHFIFDVGHQSYVHKIITGRKDDFDTLRKPGGLSGFTKRSESEHDSFGAGHSSTSLSAALGMAAADKLSGSDAYTIAVIGDGAYTGGMIHEALNNCKKDMRLIIILNENEMSISKNIGGFATQMAKIRSSNKYYKFKDATKSALERIPVVGKGASDMVRDTKQAFKNIMYDSNYFEQLGIYYMGPIDGNDYQTVKSVLKVAKRYKRSCVIHIKTKKGKGYTKAEAKPESYHSVLPAGKQPKPHNFSNTMGSYLCDMASSHDDICAITAAMGESTGLGYFKAKYPKRFFDVGIAEEHATTFAAGLCANGYKPYFAVYSSFLQRAYDNLIHDVALQDLPVTFCIDRASLAGGDGPTHHGIYDVAFLSHLPNMTLLAPISNRSLCYALESSYASKHPFAIRYPNDEEDSVLFDQFAYHRDEHCYTDYDKQDKLDLLIITYGTIYRQALEARDLLAKKGVKVGILITEQLLPYSTTMDNITQLLPSSHSRVIFLEEGVYSGGASMNISQRMLESDMIKSNKYAILAINNPFEAGKLGENLYQSMGISASHIVEKYNDIK